MRTKPRERQTVTINACIDYYCSPPRSTASLHKLHPARRVCVHARRLSRATPTLIRASCMLPATAQAIVDRLCPCQAQPVPPFDRARKRSEGGRQRSWTTHTCPPPLPRQPTRSSRIVHQCGLHVNYQWHRDLRQSHACTEGYARLISCMSRGTNLPQHTTHNAKTRRRALAKPPEDRAQLPLPSER
jgi:hypothetical protein